jgi:hypothetical protein
MLEGIILPYMRDKMAVDLPLKSPQSLFQIIDLALFPIKLHSRVQALPFPTTSPFNHQSFENPLKFFMDGSALTDEAGKCIVSWRTKSACLEMSPHFGQILQHCSNLSGLLYRTVRRLVDLLSQ